MKVQDFLALYKADPLIETFGILAKDQSKHHIQLKNLAGSLKSVLAAVHILQNGGTHLFVLRDKEEAAYFLNDLKGLLNSEKVMLFPTSYKKAYQFEEIENANVLQRSEVLSEISKKDKQNSEGYAIITYPEALCEKVINKKALIRNTITLSKGEKLNLNEIGELLNNFHFERTDFVMEPGQYAIRGYILDIFSYSSDLPYRLELMDDEVEKIRTFDPESQLSNAEKESISIIPNTHSEMIIESRESFFNYIPASTFIWMMDYAYTLEVIDKCFSKTTENFESIKASLGGSSLLSAPEVLFNSEKEFADSIKKLKLIEFGTKFRKKNDAQVIEFNSKPQLSFNKDFNILLSTLQELEAKGYKTIICSNSPKQLERLSTILFELSSHAAFTSLFMELSDGFEDVHNKIACFTDHQIFDKHLKISGKEKFSRTKGLTIKELKTLQPGDYVTHIDYGIGRFAGLEKIENNGKQQEVVRIVYKDNDFLFLSIHNLHKIAKYSGKEGGPPSISKLGSEEWENKKKKVKKKVKEIAKDLINLYAKRRNAVGFKFNPDNYLQIELESSFIYEDTPDQAKATQDTKNDMEKPYPMDRLICGDVGFGKTEIAVRAAFKAVCDSKQVAVLVPTTILALQHFKTFSERLRQFPCNVDYINRFKTTAENKETLRKVAEGKVDILIGTHRLLSNDVKFKNLGLMVIDEEQKFGVKAKEKLKEIRINVDSLTLTATPIPRTLSFSLMGARDLSIIATPPPNRQAVTTEVHTFNEAFIRDAIRAELQRDGQVFFVHNRISDIEEIANVILKLVPDAKIGIAHGQMDGTKLENIMLKFIDGDYDVLVSTNIIESGLDIPNANTIIINRAHTFGLSDLHQMRGRVGRSNKKAFCYLIAPAISSLPSDSKKRLQTLEEFSDLGDGFKVAMRDLDIRGAGDLLGAEQSGFITDLGFETYHKILDEAVQELKQSEFKELFATEINLPKNEQSTVIETDLELIIPDQYISSISERLSIYTQLDSLKSEEELQNFEKNLVDRFGSLPNQLKDLLSSIRLRWLAGQLGFEKLSIKEGRLSGYFKYHGNHAFYQSPAFGAILDYVKTHSENCHLRDLKGKLILKIANVGTFGQIKELFLEIYAQAQLEAVKEG